MTGGDMIINQKMEARDLNESSEAQWTSRTKTIRYIIFLIMFYVILTTCYVATAQEILHPAGDVNVLLDYAPTRPGPIYGFGYVRCDLATDLNVFIRYKAQYVNKRDWSGGWERTHPKDIKLLNGQTVRVCQVTLARHIEPPLPTVPCGGGIACRMPIWVGDSISAEHKYIPLPTGQYNLSVQFRFNGSETPWSPPTLVNVIPNLSDEFDTLGSAWKVDKGIWSANGTLNANGSTGDAMWRIEYTGDIYKDTPLWKYSEKKTGVLLKPIDFLVKLNVGGRQETTRAMILYGYDWLGIGVSVFPDRSVEIGKADVASDGKLRWTVLANRTRAGAYQPGAELRLRFTSDTLQVYNENDLITCFSRTSSFPGPGDGRAIIGYWASESSSYMQVDSIVVQPRGGGLESCSPPRPW